MIKLGLDASITSTTHERSNILENTGRVPDFPNCCHDVCSKSIDTSQHCSDIFKVLKIINIFFLPYYCHSSFKFCVIIIAPGKHIRPCIAMWFFIVLKIFYVSWNLLNDMLKRPVYIFYKYKMKICGYYSLLNLY